MPSLQSSNKTRMASVYAMAASLVRNKPALEALLSKEQVKLAPVVRSHLQSASLWRGLKFIAVAIKPFDQVHPA